MSKPPAFQLYAADFYMDTNTWTIDEIGIYTRLLFSEWVNGPLPNEETRLARAAGCSVKRFRSGWSQVSLKFSATEDGKLFNSRLEEVREEQKEYQEKQADKGKKGAEKRWGKHIATAMAQPMEKPQPKNGSSSSSSPSSIKNKKNKEGFTFVLPEWVPKEPWERFVEFRKGKGKFSAWSMHLIVLELDKLRGAGNDPGDVLNQSSRNEWKDVYAIKNQAIVQQGAPGGRYQSRNRIPEPVSREAQDGIERINQMARAIAQKAAIDKAPKDAQ